VRYRVVTGEWVVLLGIYLIEPDTLTKLYLLGCLPAFPSIGRLCRRLVRTRLGEGTRSLSHILYLDDRDDISGAYAFLILILERYDQTRREKKGDVRYPCWYPPQANIENFATHIEDHGVSERGGGRLDRKRYGWQVRLVVIYFPALGESDTGKG